jgi:agmatinase
MEKKPLTFANLPACTNLEQLQADIAILGIPHGTPYDLNDLHSIHAPQALRKESIRYTEDPIAWDFDLDGPLLGNGSVKVVDCLDVPGIAEAPTYNRQAATKALRQILKAGAIPVVLGGDDSIPIPVFQAFADQPPFTILQLDAHIDWRDEVNGIKEGYSSTMRRASEMRWVSSIIQVGAHGVGSARTEEMQAARAYGAQIITATQYRQGGIQAVTQHLSHNSRVFITMDYDVLDLSVMPAVGAPSPGGLLYEEVLDLFSTIIHKYEVVGVNLVEFAPEFDVRSLGTITATRVVWITVGSLVQKISQGVNTSKDMHSMGD